MHQDSSKLSPRFRYWNNTEGGTTVVLGSKAHNVCRHLGIWPSESWSVGDTCCSVFVLFAVGTGLATVSFPVQGVPVNDNEHDIETRKTDGLLPHGLVSISDWNDIILGDPIMTHSITCRVTSTTAQLFLRSDVQAFSSGICLQMCVAYVCHWMEKPRFKCMQNNSQHSE